MLSVHSARYDISCCIANLIIKQGSALSTYRKLKQRLKGLQVTVQLELNGICVMALARQMGIASKSEIVCSFLSFSTRHVVHLVMLAF